MSLPLSNKFFFTLIFLLTTPIWSMNRIFLNKKQLAFEASLLVSGGAIMKMAYDMAKFDNEVREWRVQQNELEEKGKITFEERMNNIFALRGCIEDSISPTSCRKMLKK